MEKTAFAFVSFIAVTAWVAWISYRRTHLARDSGARGYFMAGRGLTAWFIAGSMLLTNLSAEQLIGLNGNAFAYDLAAMAWESTASIATIVLALYFLPRYLRGGFSTLPQFLEERFDADTRRIVSGIFIVGYTLVANPSALYLGALAIDEVFAIHQLLGLSREGTLWLLVWATGAIGAIYAVAGGLRAVAVSDTINGLVLLIAALAVPILGLMALGGSITGGIAQIATHAPEKLNAIGDARSSAPFGTVFTGMIFANLFYWCTNQMIIQRTLAAKSLEEAQKGVLFTGFIKILTPFILLVPGIIAFLLFHDLPTPDLAYPALVRRVMPWWFIGFFIAAFFGAVISHFNSVVNSTATLFAYDFFQARHPEASDENLVRIGKRVGMLCSVLSMLIAPLLLHAPEGIFMLIRRFAGFYNIPIIAVVLVGFFSTRVAARPVKISMICHVIAYAVLIFWIDVEKRFGLNFVHLMGILFVLEVGLMLALGRVWPRASAYVPHWKNVPPPTPWRHAHAMAVFLIALLVSMFLSFSPWGFARAGGLDGGYWSLLAAVWGGALIAGICLSSRRRQEACSPADT